jgi:hemerythrin-like domain-containing protein
VRGMKATDILVQEHELILRGVAVLGRLSWLAYQPAESPGQPPFPVADGVAMVTFLREFADGRHHAKEEQVLFPALEAAGIARRGGPLGCMLAEHDHGRAAIRAMDAALAATASDPGAWRTFALAAHTYVHLLSAHIEKENHVLFRMAAEALGPEEDARIVDGYAAAERGAELADAATYAALLAALEARYPAATRAPKTRDGDGARPC